MRNSPKTISHLWRITLLLIFSLLSISLLSPAIGKADAYDLLVSSSPDRSNPVPLEGETVSGNIYVFTSPDAGVSRGSFYLDDPDMIGSPIQVENFAPYDFAGTTGTDAGPYDSSQLSDGLHEITAFIELTAGGNETVTATFSKGDTTPRLVFAPASMTFNVDEGSNTDSLSVDLSTSDAQAAYSTLTSDASWLSVSSDTATTPATLTVTVDATGLSSAIYSGTITADAGGYLSGVLSVTLNVIDLNSSIYSLMLSDSPNRTSPVSLEGQSVTGNIYVFISPESGILRVSFYLDDSGMSGTPHQVEGVAPYDFAGTTGTDAGPYDSSQLSDGLHEITAFIELTAGGNETVTATFSKGDTTPRLVFAPASMTFNVDEGSNTDSLSVDLSTSDAQAAYSTLTSDASWLSVSSDTATTPATLTVTVDATGLSSAIYSGTITADAGGYLSGVLSVTLNVIDLNSSIYSLMLSDSPNRTSPVSLEGQSVTGNIYVFISPESGILRVSFYLDDSGMSGTPHQVEGVAPYDFAGTTGTDAGPYDSSQLSDGLHEITAFIELTAGGNETVTATFSKGDTTPIVDDFEDGDAEGWDFVNDSGKASSWQVINGEYHQTNPFTSSTFIESYHIGKYSFLNVPSQLTDYRIRVDVTPLDEFGNDVGLMFRYQDNDNYYRLSLNSRYGFTRLEKKFNGVFYPLKTDSRGYITGQPYNIIVEVRASLMLVYFNNEPNNEPLFSIIDSSISSGTIALYCQGEAKFDNIQIGVNSSQTEVVISSPVAYSVVASEEGVLREVNGVVSIEAENYLSNISQGGHNWIKVTPSGFSGTGAMQTFPNNGTNNNTQYITNSPRLDFKVGFVQSGIYYLWIRGMGATGGDDSVHIGLNGGAVSTSDRISGFGSNWTWSNETMDGPVATLEIPSDGVHTVNAWMREDGFVIDKIVLSTDPTCSVCTGIEPAENPVNTADTLSVYAVATNVPGGTVEFELDGIACEPSSENPQGVFISQCLGISQGESMLDAILSDSGSTLDTNEQIGISGYNFIASGDSIFNGSNDNFKSDNISQNGKVESIQGFESNLTDLLTNSTGFPTIVFNEAIPGDESYNAAYERIKSILLRHPNSRKVLILLGINDSSGIVPSGWGCSGSTCAGTYMENMQLLIDIILGYGKEPVVALVSPAFGASNSGPPYSPDPLSGDRNVLIQQYNWVIAGDDDDPPNPPMLTGHTVGPDFFNHFLGSGVNRFSLFSDNVHPNALGMVVIAHLWHNFFTGGSDFPFTVESLIPSNYKQNLLEEGDTYYIDQNYKLVNIPPELTGNDIVWIMTANGDKDNTSPDFLSYYIDNSAAVYVAYDPRASDPPDWLINNFTSTGLVLEVTDPRTATLELYRSNIDLGPGMISMDGNKAEGADFPVGVDAANYIVIIKKN